MDFDGIFHMDFNRDFDGDSDWDYFDWGPRQNCGDFPGFLLGFHEILIAKLANITSRSRIYRPKFRIVQARKASVVLYSFIKMLPDVFPQVLSSQTIDTMVRYSHGYVYHDKCYWKSRTMVVVYASLC